MNEHFKRFPLRILVLISSPKLADKASQIYSESHLPLFYQVRGQGTATSETMDVLGLGSIDKTISISMLPKPFACTMLSRLDTELGLGKPNSGLAFTTAITGVSNPIMKLMDEQIQKELQENMEKDMKQMAAKSTHSLVIAIVNQGFSEHVMEAAKSAGAHGGTVLHARQMGSEETLRFWGITIQQEKEMVLILAGAEAKLGIMKALGEKCGMHSEARGFILSTPIDMMAGFWEGDTNGK